MELIETQIVQFYKYFQPNYIACVLYNVELFNEKKEYKNTELTGKFVETYEEFLNFCKEYHMKGSLFSVYRKLKPHTNREMDNIISSKCFFIDIDNDSDNKESIAFENLLKQNGLTFNIKIKSGSGKHYYIPHPIMDIDDSNREHLIDMSSRLKFWLQENNIKIDPKIYDIARLTRIWGSYNIKAQAYCEVLSFKEADTEKEDNNLNFLSKIQPKAMQVFNVQNTKCNYCPLIEYCINNNLGKENTMKNDVLFKNAAAFIRENKRKESDLRKMALKQKHSEAEFFSSRGWWNKHEIQFNCYELKKWTRDFYPELVKDTCRKCMFENVNNIIYVNDDNKNFNQLKNEYRDTGKLPINKYITVRGVLESAKEFKTALLVGSIYKKNAVADEEEITLEDIDKDVSLYTRYIGEKEFTKEETIKLKIAKLRDLKVDFYVYNFISQGVLYKVLSEDALPADEYYIDGCMVEINDKILLGEKGIMSGYVKILFCHTARSTSVKYNSWDEVFNRFNYSEENLTNYLCSLAYNEDEGYVYEQPALRMKLYYAFLFSSQLENYPLHLVVSGIPGVGKSKMLTSLFNKFPNEIPPVGAEVSTIKGFIPSYYSKKPTRGFLMEAHRILFVDEFFGLMSRASQNSQNSETADVLQGFNNILMNEDRVSGSGTGRFKLKMSAKTLWATNPTDVFKEDFISSLKKLEVNTLQRFLFFHIGKDGIDWIQEQPSHMKKGVVSLDSKDWMALYDFMQDKKMSKVEFDQIKIEKIMNELKNSVPADMVSHLYHMRTIKHSAPLIMEGIIKTRIIFEKDKNLYAKEIDYVLFKQLWEYIINSWKSGLVNWSSSLKKQLSVKQLEMLELIPYEGIWDSKLKRDCRKIGLNDEEIKYNLNWFRNIGVIYRGDEKDNDKNLIFKTKETEIQNIDEITNQTKQQTL